MRIRKAAEQFYSLREGITEKGSRGHSVELVFQYCEKPIRVRTGHFLNAIIKERKKSIAKKEVGGQYRL